MCSVLALEVACLPTSLSCAVVLRTPHARAFVPGLERGRSFRACHRLQQNRNVIVRAGGAEEEVEEEVKQTSFSITRFAAQALICVITLGFLDAGYSGDWSRIGVLSKEAESALRMGAFGVVPFSLFLLWFVSFSNRRS